VPGCQPNSALARRHEAVQAHATEQATPVQALLKKVEQTQSSIRAEVNIPSGLTNQFVTFSVVRVKQLSAHPPCACH
jgi:hypothetical protein